MQKLRKGDAVELEIEKMAFGGQGIARADGFVVFVRGAVPGDRVLARLYKKKKAFGEAKIEEILASSPDRIDPPCPYSGLCGGCQWQQLRYEKQIQYKREHVSECVERIGGLTGIEVQEVCPAEREFGYRNKMEFSFSDRRWLPPDQFREGQRTNEHALGLHVPGTFSKVIDIEACLLQHPEGNEILRFVRDFVKESGIPVYGLKSHEGFWRYLTLRRSVACGDWMVNIVTSEERPAWVQPLSEALADRFQRLKTVVNNVNRRAASIAVGEREIPLLGDGVITDRIGPYAFRISANSFFQTNSPGAGTLYEQVLAYAELTGAEAVLDLYSGTGTIPIFMSKGAKTVTGIEIAPSAVQDAWKNCRENGIDNCTFICGDAATSLSQVRERPDVLIVDPPRAGMHKDVLDQVLKLLPERVVYVSCNPSTLARDLAQMAPHYEVLEVKPFDLFPHTYHVETAVKLHRRNKKA